MNPQPLSPETRRRLDLLFSPTDRPAAEAILASECGNNLPFLEKLDMFQLERFHYAAYASRSSSSPGRGPGH